MWPARHVLETSVAKSVEGAVLSKFHKIIVFVSCNCGRGVGRLYSLIRLVRPAHHVAMELHQ